MAATLEIPTTRPGETLTLSAFPDGSDTAAFTGESLTEASNRDGVYSYSNATATGLHLLVLYAGAVPRWQAWAVLATSGTVVAAESRLEALYLDASVSSRAAPGAEMDLVDAPNATAVTAIQDGLSTFDAGANTVNLDAAYDAAKTAAQAGGAMTLSDGAITAAKIADGAITNAKIGSEIARQAKLDTVDSGVTAIKAVTDALPDAGSLTSLAQGDDLAAVDSAVDAIQAKTDKLDFTGTGDALKSEATNMRGTDSAVTSLTGIATATDVSNAQSAITDAIGDLHDFDPASDTVARVTLVDTTTTNSDMRGTDGAVTSLTGIATEANATSNAAALAGAITALNDLDETDVQNAAAAALTAYGALKPTTSGRTLNVNEDGTVASTAEVSEASIRSAIGLEEGNRVATPADVQVSVTPNVGTVPEPNAGVDITAYVGETIPRTITVTDANNEPVSLEGKTLRIVVEEVNGTDVDVAEHEDIVISGEDNNNATWTPQASTFSQDRVLRLAIWSLSEETGDYVILPGTITVTDVARKDAT